MQKQMYNNIFFSTLSCTFLIITSEVKMYQIVRIKASLLQYILDVNLKKIHEVFNLMHN